MKNRRNDLRRGDIGWLDLGEHPETYVQSGRKICIIVNTNGSNSGVYTVIFGNCKIEKKDFSVHMVIIPKDVKGGLLGKCIYGRTAYYD